MDECSWMKDVLPSYIVPDGQSLGMERVYDAVLELSPSFLLFSSLKLCEEGRETLSMASSSEKQCRER